MNDTSLQPDPAAAPTPDDRMTALFANLVLQLTQMGLMLMGKAPHPGSGETVRDLEHAQLMVDQLEMLEVKTKGNLGAEESRLLQQSLMTLRLAFVEAVDAPAEPGQPAAEPADASAPPASDPASPSAAAAAAESKRKFTKKY